MVGLDGGPATCVVVIPMMITTVATVGKVRGFSYYMSPPFLVLNHVVTLRFPLGGWERKLSKKKIQTTISNKNLLDHQEHDCPLLPPGEQWFAHRPAGGQVTDSKIKRAPDKVIKGLWDSWRAYRWKKKPDPIIDQKTGYKKTGTKKGWSKRK